MTIYKFSSNEKKPEDNVEGKEVVADLLKSEVTETDVAPSPAITMSVMYTTAMRRRRYLLYSLIALAVLTFIASAAIGVIYLYHHFNYVNRHKAAEKLIDEALHEPMAYGVNYYETPEEEAANRPHGYLKETIQLPQHPAVPAYSYERIEVPQFDECASSIIVHDFIYNFTVIVDKDSTRCFVMKLNRTLVVPPYDVIDLVRKLWTGHYTPKVRTLREKYVVSPHPVRDVSVFGKFVAAECHSYTTFRLIKYRSFLKKMMRRLHDHYYGYYAFRDNVIKIEVRS